MDLWFVAAAAGVGYLAKYWQNISQDREGLLALDSGSSLAAKPESQPSIEQIHDKTSSLHKLAQRKSGQQASTDTDDENFSDGRFMGTIQLDNPLSAEVPSTSGFDAENQEFLRNCEEHNLLCLSKYPTVPNYDKGQEFGDGNRSNGDVGNTAANMLERSTWGMGMSHGFKRGQSSLRSRRSHWQFLKPLNSLESCLTAQMYKEHAEMEEYVLSPFRSPCIPTLRPFYVADGSRIISKSSDDSFAVWFNNDKEKSQKESHLKANKEPSGLPHLPKIASAELSWKRKDKKGNDQTKKPPSLNNLIKEVQFHSQGTPNGAILFCLGISMGILSSIVADIMEVEKLRELLKQTENLVQDLQEELEMKDSLTVQELVNENDVLQDARDSFPSDQKHIVFSTQLDSKEAIKYANEDLDAQNAAEKPELTIIEAELEAELERLEVNMKESTLHGGLSDVFEFDQDFVAEVVQGDLRADMLSRNGGSDSISFEGSSSNSTPQSAKYAVSPRELSLRLHRVIQSRLEERIMELEVALEKSQKRAHHLESEQLSSWEEFMHSESSSTQGSPIDIEAVSPMARPLIMNLSGEALDAYNEACEELGAIYRSKIDDSVFKLNINDQHRVHTFGGHQDRQQSLEHNEFTEENGMIAKASVAQPLVKEEETWPNTGITQQSREVTPNGNENSDDDFDDMEQLIKQIVEKTRQGSPAVLQAHRAMISMYTE
ncbi:hypothetical protein Ancab_036038 [Ancistrocladus abbreviatus]